MISCGRVLLFPSEEGERRVLEPRRFLREVRPPVATGTTSKTPLVLAGLETGWGLCALARLLG